MPDPDPASMTFVYIITFLILLILTALFHMCDEAFFAIGETRIRELCEDNNRNALKIRKLLSKERQFTSRIRLNTSLSSIAASLVFLELTPIILSHSSVKASTFTESALYALMLICSLILLGTLGNLLPRRLIHLNSEAVALFLVNVFTVFHALLYPFYGVCRLISWPFVKLVGMDPHDDPDKVTEDDIIELIEDVEEIGALEESQKDMLNNIFEFDDITASEIMTPRTDMIAAEVADPLSDALSLAIENGYSRLPIYEDDIDHIIGILYIKDLLPYVGKTLPKSVNTRALLRETYFVPDTKKCDELFEEMNEKHLQMSIVVDEYGGVAGIVTIEDLLEAIVGNMQDEFDHEEEEVTQLDDDSFEVDGTLSISELGELLNRDFPEGDYDTVAGFLLDLLGHIPEENEETVIEYENLTFTIQEMEDRRIEQVLICRTADNRTVRTEED